MSARVILALAALAAGPAWGDDDPPFKDSDWVIETPEAVIIRSDGGGNIHDYADLIAALDGREVRILGVCKSSCTMFLGLPQTCVAEGASLGFHGPRSNDQGIRNLLGLVDKIAAHHPPVIAEMFRTDWGMTREFTWLTGAEALALEPGLKRCDEGVRP